MGIIKKILMDFQEGMLRQLLFFKGLVLLEFVLGIKIILKIF